MRRWGPGGRAGNDPTVPRTFRVHQPGPHTWPILPSASWRRGTAAERLGELERFLEDPFGPRAGRSTASPSRAWTGCRCRTRCAVLRLRRAVAVGRPGGPARLLPPGPAGTTCRPPDDVRRSPTASSTSSWSTRGTGRADAADRRRPARLVERLLAEGDPDERTVRVCDSLSKFLVTHGLMTILYEMENAPGTVDAARARWSIGFAGTGLGDEAVRIWDTSGLDWPDSVRTIGARSTWSRSRVGFWSTATETPITLGPCGRGRSPSWSATSCGARTSEPARTRFSRWPPGPPSPRVGRGVSNPSVKVPKSSCQQTPGLGRPATVPGLTGEARGGPHL